MAIWHIATLDEYHPRFTLFRDRQTTEECLPTMIQI